MSQGFESLTAYMDKEVYAAIRERDKIAEFIQDLIDSWGGTYLMSMGGLQTGRDAVAFEIRKIGSPPKRYNVIIEEVNLLIEEQDNAETRRPRPDVNILSDPS